MKYFVFIVIGYMSGSVLFAKYLPALMKGVDVAALSDDGNPGATNAFKHAGPLVGTLVLLLDVLKGFLPVFFAAHVLDTGNYAFALVLAAPVIGHAYPLYSGFRGGGKAIAASFGVLLGLLPDAGPLLVLAALYLLFSFVIVVEPHLLRSILTFLLLNMIELFFGRGGGVSLGVMLLSVVAVLRHAAGYHGQKPSFHVRKAALAILCALVILGVLLRTFL